MYIVSYIQYLQLLVMNSSQSSEPVFAVQTVQEAVIKHLRHLILTGKLKRGQRLVQTELSTWLGVSRTPIREALNQLAHDGLVRISNYKGATVAEFSIQDLVEIYTVRTALESHATYLATQRIQDEQLVQLKILMQEMGEAFRSKDFERLLSTHKEFHIGIYRVAGRAHLDELIFRYLDLSNVYQRMALSLGRGANDPIKEHVEILETLRQRDPDQAYSLMKVHLELTMKELLELFQEQQKQDRQEE
jgi:DNA-binding GntR family transcriptional regulator